MLLLPHSLLLVSLRVPLARTSPQSLSGKEDASRPAKDAVTGTLWPTGVRGVCFRRPQGVQKRLRAPPRPWRSWELVTWVARSSGGVTGALARPAGHHSPWQGPGG